MLKVSVEVDGSVLVVRVDGEMDLSTAPQFRSEVENALDRTLARDLLLNLKGLAFIDSSGLGAILGRYRRISEAGGRMVLSGVNNKIRPVLKLSGLERIMPLYDSEKEAMASFKGVR